MFLVRSEYVLVGSCWEFAYTHDMAQESYKNVNSFLGVEQAIKSLSKAERPAFHNVAVSMVAMAKNVGVHIAAPQMKRLIDFSREVSPQEDPSAWLKHLRDIWKKAPGAKLVLGADVEDNALKWLTVVQRRQNSNPWYDNAFQNVLAEDYTDGHMPEFVSTDIEQGQRGRDAVSSWINSYGEQNINSARVIFRVEGLAGQGERELFFGLAYDKEDITTSHVLQALKLRGYELDEQSDAQLEAFGNFSKVDLPETLIEVGRRLSMYIPSYGRCRLVGLEQLHAQAHTYDLEALKALKHEPDSPEGPELEMNM